jgi:hypothetical protein
MPLIDYRYAPWQASYWPATIIAFARKPKGRRLRHLALANPALPDGGLFLFSKIEAASLLKQYGLSMPPFAVAENGRVLADPENVASATGRVWIKPEFGMRKRGLDWRIGFDEALRASLGRSGRHLLQAEAAGREHAIGFLRSADGALSVRWLVEKVNLELIGDGRSSLGALIEASGRGKPEKMREKLGPEWDEILAAGERRVLAPIGSFSWGSRFHKVEPYPAWAIDIARRLDPCAGLDCFKLDVILGPDGAVRPIDFNGTNGAPMDSMAEPFVQSRVVLRLAEHLLEAIECGWRREQAGAKLPSWSEMRRKSRHMLATLGSLKQA